MFKDLYNSALRYMASVFMGRRWAAKNFRDLKVGSELEKVGTTALKKTVLGRVIEDVSPIDCR